MRCRSRETQAALRFASAAAPCVPYNIWSDGGVTQDALAYLYTDGTGYGSTTLRTLHADFTGDLGEYGIKLPQRNEGLSVNFGYESRDDKVKFKPDEAELSGLLSGFGGAAVAIDEGLTGRRILRRDTSPVDTGQTRRRRSQHRRQATAARIIRRAVSPTLRSSRSNTRRSRALGCARL